MSLLFQLSIKCRRTATDTTRFFEYGHIGVTEVSKHYFAWIFVCLLVFVLYAPYMNVHLSIHSFISDRADSSTVILKSMDDFWPQLDRQRSFC